MSKRAITATYLFRMSEKRVLRRVSEKQTWKDKKCIQH
jgi:hypothetical protein